MKHETDTLISLQHNMVAHDKTRTFRFGALKVTDDEATLQGGGLTVALGEIELLMYSIERYEDRAIRVKYKQGTRGETEIHETAKQTLQHCVPSGEEVKEAEPPPFLKAVGKKLAGKVAFKYRNIGCAATTSPVVNSRKRKARESPVKIEIDLEEELRLAEEDRELVEARLAAIRGRIASGGSSSKRVKTEVKMERIHSSLAGEVIDLTLD
ncbi:hypothetical protein BKA70DRAFT_1558804 [Coprinopsis sp. MPI-PUGE-AT-0042]|nr:hypothetical protein BKA70DRAFT_1558804 [Coprinopsis sp. MPI-PUGE-AT-0042]